MMRKIFLVRRLRYQAAGCLCALVLSGAVPLAGGPAAAQSASSVSPGTARIWFYRDYAPYSSRSMASVTLNEAVIGYAQPQGGSFYRDVAPGRYHVTAGDQG